jgi:peptidoglycan/xylan/chitin deacetylase (PgdA/CDA1 family)
MNIVKNKLPASLSLDLDNQWSYMKIHGDEGWDKYPSYLDTFIPHVLKVLDELGIKITFFIVGQDASIQTNHKALRMITYAGHEVGNHSFSHESWLNTLPKEKIIKEIELTETFIDSTTGMKPIGFRGPGFSWSKDVLEILHDKGYLYDASTLPTWIGPFARQYYFWTSKLSREEKKERGKLFGTFSDGLRRLKPYNWDIGYDRRILEIPVSTMPVFRIPFHLSYLLYISTYSEFLMNIYLGIAVRLCKITRTPISFLLHPLDLIGGDQLPELEFFPGMKVKSDVKVRIFKKVIERLSKHFDIMNMSSFAKEMLKKKVKVKDI